MSQRNSLDELLKIALQKLYEDWRLPKTGIVGAAVRLSGGRVMSATSLMVEEGVFEHAESRLFKLVSKEGAFEELKGADLAISLSPCIKPSSCRLGPSCSELITDVGIKSVRFGTIDPMQGDIRTYSDYPFIATNTSNHKLKITSETLFSLFAQHGDLINFEIERIKSESDYIYKLLQNVSC